MMHTHSWLRDTTRNRFTCTECFVVGHKPALLGGQHRTAKTGVVPYACQRKIDGKVCGAEAVHVTGDRQQSRCAEHAPAKAVAA
ncbi:MAG TPA: hypothetical protein VN650_02155 [Gemmatimonadaceae bacterium]|nr:hypothetical protein [Gemmatimonadaceae bacterium]